MNGGYFLCFLLSFDPDLVAVPPRGWITPQEDRTDFVPNRIRN